MQIKADNMDNIIRLKQLTKELDELVLSRGNGKVEYGDGITGVSLLSLDEIAVMDLHLPKGSEFPLHHHVDFVECGILYKGKLSVTHNDNVVIMDVGQQIYFDKLETHSAIALEDTSLISVSIPRGRGYP